MESIKKPIVEGLITGKIYSLDWAKKSEILLGIIKKQLLVARSNKFIRNFLERQDINIASLGSLAEIPFLPVQMFKYFDLATCPSREVVRVVESSGTTSATVSRVPLDKNTIQNQTRALAETVAHYLGRERRIFLVIDHAGINAPNQTISARTMGVRGLGIGAKRTLFLLKEVGGKLVLDEAVIKEVADKYEAADVYIFGFTYIVWSVFVKQMLARGFSFRFKSGTLFHSGGWKKMTEEKVSKQVFIKAVADLFSIRPTDIRDFYGMAEQGGVIFVDCERGNKHVPHFAAVIVRDWQTLKPAKFNQSGLIEVMSVLANSYYGQAILTEDLGFLMGIDDCPCGRKGEYFRFQARAEKTELRGCGDTFREDN